MSAATVAVEVFFLDLPTHRSVQAERVFVDPLDDDLDPTDLVIGLADARRGSAPRFVHSTSWRYDAGRVILTYAVLVPEAMLASPMTVPLDGIAIASGTEADPRPDALETDDVLRHAVRHLAFLVAEGSAATDGLSAATAASLRALRPAAAGLIADGA